MVLLYHTDSNTLSYVNICEIAILKMMANHSLIGSISSFLAVHTIMMYLTIKNIWDSNVIQNVEEWMN